MPPVLSTDRIAHLGTAGDCCAAAFQSSLFRFSVACPLPSGADKVDSAEGMARLEAMSSHHNFRPGQQNKLVLEPPIAAPDEHAQLVEQFPPSDGDCHTPLPREVRKSNHTTPRACSLHVQGGQDAGCSPLSSASRSEILLFCTLLGRAKRADNLRLPVSCNVAVARKRRQHIL